MLELHAASVAEVRTFLSDLGEQLLFRGQTAHYGSADQPSFVTSFDRKGCIPSEMLKWSRYASNVLETFIGSRGGTLEFQQALLQHYGWRSFYMDCSFLPTVAAWFASHVYTDKPIIELCEDYEERPVMLCKRMARYDFEEGEGHLYVLDLKRAAELVGVVDLAALKIDGFSPRTDAQAAWLLGPLRNRPVPAECVIAHVTAPRSVFRDYAAEDGLVETGHLFPSRREDPVLDALLGLPWKSLGKVSDEPGSIPLFKRALDLPEYQDSYVKIISPRVAFFEGKRIADTIESIDGDRNGGIGMSVPEIAIFGVPDERTPRRFPMVQALLAEHGSVAFEIDELIQHASMGRTVLYQKGIGVMAHEPDLVELSELMVEHPGLDMTKAGFVRGWFYRIDADGLWQREAHPDECSCGGDATHLRHISALHIIEHYLRAPDEFDV